MSTVFLSGSRKISRLNQDIITRLQNIIESGLAVIVGDANGADKAFQKFLADANYKNVTVFCSGNECRNNLGGWKIQNVEVDSRLKDRDFYTQKDKVMAIKADYGLILWDGKSTGSVNNVFELLRNEKVAVVYFQPEKKFYNIKNLQEADKLLKRVESEDLEIIKKKIKLTTTVREINEKAQQALIFG